LLLLLEDAPKPSESELKSFDSCIGENIGDWAGEVVIGEVGVLSPE
jgi:hypothetical protein